MEKRLQELRAEYELGKRHLEQLERQCREVRETLLRISGAIQVLEELRNVPEPAAELVSAEA